MCPTSRPRSQVYRRLRTMLSQSAVVSLVVLPLLLLTTDMSSSALTTTQYGSASGLRLRSAQGKPCLDFRPITRREVVIDKTFDHVVIITNACSKAIDVKLCYKSSQASCKNVHVTGYERRSIILGVMYDVSTFAFDYEESFSK